MKKNLAFISLSVVAMALGAGVSLASVNNIAAKAETSASEWAVSNGDTSQLKVTDIENGVQFSNLYTYGADVVKTEKVYFDGLSFNFSNMASLGSSCVEFYFSNSNGWGMHAPTISIWRGLYSGQTRINIGNDHDYNPGVIAQNAPKPDAPYYSFSGATSIVMNCTDADDSFRFEVIDYDDYWGFKFYGEQIWGNNANYNASEKSTLVFVAKSRVAPVIDAEGKTYLHVAGIGNGGGAKITNLVEVEPQSYVRVTPEHSVNNWEGCYCTPTISSCEKGVIVNGLSTNGHRAKLNIKLPLDGLSFIYGSNGKDTRCGFYFKPTDDKSYFTEIKTTVVITHRPSIYSGQDRTGVSTSHDSDSKNYIAYTYMSGADADKNGGVLLNTPNDSGRDDLRYTFNKVNDSWWKVTVSAVFEGQFNNSHKAFGNRYDADTNTKFYYIPASNFAKAIDAEGYTYLALYGMSANVDQKVAEISFLEPGVSPERVEEAKQEIRNINLRVYPGDLEEDMTAVIESGVAACDLAKTEGDLQRIVLNTKAEIRQIYADYIGYGQTIISDGTAHLRNWYGSFLNAVGYGPFNGFVAHFGAAYGARYQLLDKIEVGDFIAKINFAALPVNAATYFGFNLTESGYVNDAQTTVCHFEFYKVEETKYMVIFGNSNSHNISIADWARESTSNGYTGRYMYSDSGMFTISMDTDYENQKSTLVISGDTSETLEFDSKLINRNEALAEGTKQNVLFSSISNIGEEYLCCDFFVDRDTMLYYMARETLHDAAISFAKEKYGALRERFAGRNMLDDETMYAYVEAYLEIEEEIEDKLPELLRSYDLEAADEELDFLRAIMEAPINKYLEVLETEVAMFAEYVANFDVTPYRASEAGEVAVICASTLALLEEVSSFGELKEVKDLFEASIKEIRTDADYLTASKNSAIILLDLTDLTVYTGENLRQVTTIIETAKARIRKANTTSEVDTISRDAEKAIAAVKTDAQIKAAELKTAKDEALEVVEARYARLDEPGKKAVADKYNEVKTNINNATSKEQIDMLVKNFKTDVDTATQAKGCSGSLIATSLIITLAAIGGISFLSLKKRKEN